MDWKKIPQENIRNAERVLQSCGLEDKDVIQTIRSIGRVTLSTELYPEPQYFATSAFTEKDISKCKDILKKAGIGAADWEQVLDTILDFLTDGQIRRNMVHEKSDEDDIMFVSARDKAILKDILCKSIDADKDDANTFYAKTGLLRQMGFVKEASDLEESLGSEPEEERE